MKTYTLAACGGTFDHFHKGHREFLIFALSHAKNLVIGITSGSYIKESRVKSQESRIELFEDRKKSVETFLFSINARDRAQIIAIDDVFGSTLTKSSIDVLVVSENTQEGSSRINQEREKRMLPLLPILVHKMVLTDDGLLPISSSRIRLGEINREGKIFIPKSWLIKDRILTEQLRTQLQKSLGDFIPQNDIANSDLDPLTTVTVGDVVTKAGNDAKFGQKISVVDFFVQRQKVYSDLKELGFSGKEHVFFVKNPAGSITASLFLSVKEAVNMLTNHGQIILQVEGEEDLAVLPFILMLPLGWNILYGQPNIGVVRVLVTEEIKEKAYNIVEQFEEM